MIASLKSLKIALIAVACSAALSSIVYGNRKSDFDFKDFKFKVKKVEHFDFKKDKFEGFKIKDFKIKDLEKKIKITRREPFLLELLDCDYPKDIPDCDYPKSVPDGGSTLALLGVGLMGLVALGRRFSLVK